jgi:CheY-like chemotaxis protein
MIGVTNAACHLYFGCGFAAVAITAETERERCLEVGFDFHFVKPADPDAVTSVLEGLAASR